MGQHLGSTDVAGIVAVVYLKFSESQSLVNTTDTLDNWATPRGRAFSVEIQSAQNTVLSVQCEPVSEIAGNSLSRRQLAPLDHGGGAVLLEYFAVVEMTVEIKMIVDRGMNGREFLQGFHVSEFRHRAFPSSERLV